MQRIPDNKGRLKIEHWAPQTRHGHLQLDYKNLLGSCLGGQGSPKHLQYCDTHKADQEITINPTDPNCESLVKFKRKSESEDLNFIRAAKHSLSGEITSDNPTIENELNKILNLNLQTLVEHRRAAFEVFMELFEKNHAGTWSRELIERVIKKWSSPLNKRYEEYCQIIVYYLRTKL